MRKKIVMSFVLSRSWLVIYPPRKDQLIVDSPIEIRKVITGVVLTMLWVCIFLFSIQSGTPMDPEHH